MNEFKVISSCIKIGMAGEQSEACVALSPKNQSLKFTHLQLPIFEIPCPRDILHFPKRKDYIFYNDTGETSGGLEISYTFAKAFVI